MISISLSSVTLILGARALFRTVYFAPMVMPSVAIAVLWSYIYLPQQGLLDQAIRLFNTGFGGDWLGSPNTALLCVFAAFCWRYAGFYMVLFMAGIAAIPEEVRYDVLERSKLRVRFFSSRI